MLAALSISACGKGADAPRHMESYAELKARQDKDFAESPDIQVPEGRSRLSALGVPDSAVKDGVEENGVPILLLTLDEPTFERLDKKALAKLEIDSRYRFEMTKPDQIRAFAAYSVAETQARDKGKAIRELAEKGESDRIPRYRAGMDMTDYARSLESYCGYPRGAALRVIDGNLLDYNPQMARDAAIAASRGQSWAQFACVKRIVDATDLGAHFIGNRGRDGAMDS